MEEAVMHKIEKRRQYRSSPLSKLRREAGFPGVRHAEVEVGFSRQRLAQWEAGAFFPSDEHIIAMANAYKSTPAAIAEAAARSWVLGVNHRRFVRAAESTGVPLF